MSERAYQREIAILRRAKRIMYVICGFAMVFAVVNLGSILARCGAFS